LVPLSNDAVAVLKELPRFRRGDHLFSFTFGERPALVLHNAKVKIDALMLRYLRALARLRYDQPPGMLTPWVVHDIRRTVRTKLAELGVNDNVAEMAVGHAKKGLQRIYDLHSYEPEIRKALELWAAELRRIVNPAQPTNVVLLQRPVG
jgi:integrase